MDILDITRRTRSILDEVGSLGVSIESLSDDDDLYAAGLTSRASVHIMLAVEDEFDIEFPDHMLNRHTFQSIASIRDGICSMVDSEDN
jgi:acyl carrier protein